MNQHWLLSRAEPNCALVLCRPMKVAETPQQRTWAPLKRASGRGGGTVVWRVLAPPAVTGRAQNRKPALERKLCALENSWWANHFQQLWWRSPEMSGCLSLSGKRKGRNFSHGKKTHSRTPADCLDFSNSLQPGVVCIQLDDVISLCCYFFFSFDVSPEVTLCSAQNSVRSSR